MELVARIELATFGLRIRCTTDCAIPAYKKTKKNLQSEVKCTDLKISTLLIIKPNHEICQYRK